MPCNSTITGKKATCLVIGEVWLGSRGNFKSGHRWSKREVGATGKCHCVRVSCNKPRNPRLYRTFICVAMSYSHDLDQTWAYLWKFQKFAHMCFRVGNNNYGTITQPSTSRILLARQPYIWRIQHARNRPYFISTCLTHLAPKPKSVECSACFWWVSYTIAKFKGEDR